MNTKKGFRLRVGIPSREDYIVRSIVMGFKCETEACTLSQWLFKNLRNATFTRLPTKALDHYLHEKDVPALETMEESSKLIAAVEYGVLDFALLKVYPQPMQTLICDISPIISITSVCILSSMSPESDDSEVMSLVVLDTFVLSFTIGSLLFVSIIAFAFSSILHKRKANVTTLLKHIWIFTADILQNQDLSVLGRNLYMMFFLGAWILASMVIAKGYSGSLKCDMIVSKNQPIHTIEDVIARKNVAPFILESSNFYYAVKEYREYTKLKSRADKLNSYYRSELSELDDIKQDFCDGKAVIFASRQYHKSILQKYFSAFDKRKVLKMYIGDGDYEPRSLHYYMYKGLNKDLRENLVYLIARYVETRQSIRFKYVKDRLYSMVLFQGPLSINLTKTLTARFLGPAFFLYLSGILISMIVVFVEVIFYFISNKRIK